MIETRQTVSIRAAIGDIWSHVRDIRRWAAIMPGYQSCDVIDDDRSRWVLKVGVGGLVRTVTVLVRVDRWDGPARAEFSYKLEGDPVSGSGTYCAETVGEGETAITLAVTVEGGGPLAPMWEAMGAPLLPKFARNFAEQLRDDIESAAAATPAPPERRSLLSRIVDWLRRRLGLAA